MIEGLDGGQVEHPIQRCLVAVQLEAFTLKHLDHQRPKLGVERVDSQSDHISHAVRREVSQAERQTWRLGGCGSTMSPPPALIV
jgi:hypothetical protein